MGETSICRLCMKGTKEYIFIFDDDTETEILHLLNLFQLIITRDPVKSNMICMKCYLKLVDFQKFHERCVENEKLWDKFKMSEVLVDNKSDDDLNEHVDDFLTVEFSDVEKNEKEQSVTIPADTRTNEELNSVSTVKDEKKLFECEICHKNYARKDGLTRHMKSHSFHNHEELKNGSEIKDERHECDFCYKKFVRKDNLSRHMKRHINNRKTNKKEINCKKVKKAVDQALLQKLEAEYKQIRETFDLKCPKSDCDFLSQTFNEYKSHLRTIHKERRPGLVCCGKKLEKRISVIDHIHLHLNPEKLQCKHCNRIYCDTTSLKSHINRVHGSDEVKRYTCERCGKRFFELEGLRSHMFIHLPDETRKSLRIYKCDICGKTFLHKNTLTKHIKYDHLKQGFMCTGCAQLFNSKFDFELHRRDVHGEKGPSRLQCPTCKQWYSNRRSLRIHIQSQHSVTQSIACQICSKEFSNKTNLRKHFQINHMERAFKCEYCPKSFPTAERLKEHTAMHTGIALYSCPYCSNKHFNRRVNMYQHFKRMHSKEWEKDKVRNEQNSNRRKFASKYKRT